MATGIGARLRVLVAGGLNWNLTLRDALKTCGHLHVDRARCSGSNPAESAQKASLFDAIGRVLHLACTVLLCVLTLLASYAPTSARAQSTPDTCNPQRDVCVPKVSRELYGLYIGYCLQGSAYPANLQPPYTSNCGGFGFFSADLKSEDEAVAYLIRLETGDAIARMGALCGPVQAIPTDAWYLPQGSTMWWRSYVTKVIRNLATPGQPACSVSRETQTGTPSVGRYFGLACPDGHTTSTSTVDGSSVCKKNLLAELTAGQSCKAPSAGLLVGNPIFPATNEKVETQADFEDAGPAALTFVRTYRSNWSTDASRVAASMGQVWTHDHHYELAAKPMGAPTSVAITLPEGHIRQFSKAAGASVWTISGSADTLIQAGSAWTWRRADDDVTFNFTDSGKLQTSVTRNGWATTYAYNAVGQLATISNGFNRTLTLAYNGAGRLATVTTPDARVIAYAYDATGRLSSVTYPCLLYTSPSPRDS